MPAGMTNAEVKDRRRQRPPAWLRHRGGRAKISLNLIRRGWGQAQLSTRCIDLEAVGAEEQCLAARRQE